MSNLKLTLKRKRWSTFSPIAIKLQTTSRLIGACDNISKKRGTIYSHRDADDMLQNISFELDKYVIDKELQRVVLGKKS
jgi:hypothetical protein